MLLSQGRMGCSGRGQDLSRHGMRHAPSSACFPCRDFGSGLGESHVRDSDGAGGMRRSRLGTTGMHRLHPPRPDPHLAPRRAKKHQECFSSLWAPQQQRPSLNPGHVTPKTVNFAFFFFFFSLQICWRLLLPFQQTQAAAQKRCDPPAKQLPPASRWLPGLPRPPNSATPG